MSHLRRLTCAAVLVTAPSLAIAQRAAVPLVRPSHTGAPVRADTGRPMLSPRWAPIASLIVPGSGQLAMRQSRGAAYIAAEAYAWLVYREYARDARDKRAEYKRTAREVARRAFGGQRDTAAWAYYEAVLDYDASGRFNLTPGRALTPEPDTSTFNGHIWLDARSLYWRDPDVAPPASDPTYLRALEHYTSRAVQGEFMWSWTNQGLQQQIYKDAIDRENQVTRYRNAVLNVMIVNHVLSAIDALTSVRLRESRGPNGERRYEATIPWAPFGRPRQTPK